jgi:hypothetical protein
MRVGKGELLAFKETRKASPGSGPKKAVLGCIISENDIMSRFHGHIMPKTIRMMTIKRIVPNPPMG